MKEDHNNLKAREQVLIVEDDENDAFFIKKSFQAAGIPLEPHIAKNGQEAIAYLEGQGEYADRERYPYPKWIMTDLKMPVMDGFGVLGWLNRHPALSVIPVVVFTSSSDEKDAKKAYCLGAHAYIVKPTDSTEFRKIICSLVTFWEQCVRPRPDVPPDCNELLAEIWVKESGSPH